MSLIENTLAWCQEERAQLQLQLERLQSGQMKTGEKRMQVSRCVDVDTTTESITRCQRYIAQIDAILADYGRP